MFGVQSWGYCDAGLDGVVRGRGFECSGSNTDETGCHMVTFVMLMVERRIGHEVITKVIVVELNEWGS